MLVRIAGRRREGNQIKKKEGRRAMQHAAACVRTQRLCSPSKSQRDFSGPDDRHDGGHVAVVAKHTSVVVLLLCLLVP